MSILKKKKRELMFMVTQPFHCIIRKLGKVAIWCIDFFFVYGCVYQFVTLFVDK